MTDWADWADWGWGAGFGFLVGWYFRVYVWQRLLHRWFPNLYAPVRDGRIEPTRTEVKVICPDCEVGEPHLCPLLEPRRSR